VTRADFIRQQRECRATMRELAKLFPDAFDKNGKAIVAVAAFPRVPNIKETQQ
jgi:hypothetical protein